MCVHLGTSALNGLYQGEYWANGVFSHQGAFTIPETVVGLKP